MSQINKIILAILFIFLSILPTFGGRSIEKSLLLKKSLYKKNSLYKVIYNKTLIYAYQHPKWDVTINDYERGFIRVVLQRRSGLTINQKMSGIFSMSPLGNYSMIVSSDYPIIKDILSFQIHESMNNITVVLTINSEDYKLNIERIFKEYEDYIKKEDR
jgi:hypothetical protein